jgi:four helix bundle protein
MATGPDGWRTSSFKFEISNIKSHLPCNHDHATLNPIIAVTYQSFEELPVWQKAAELYELTEDLLDNAAFKAARGFRDQLDRASLSVSNNIAEGFERGTTNELLAFIYIARGSAGEVRSMLTLKLRRAIKAGWPANIKSDIENLKSIAESCSRQLRGWADALQNSDIKGQRHLNDKTRRADEQKKRAQAFDITLLKHLPAWHPKRKEAEESGLI